MANVDFYSAIITKVSNALNTLVSGEQPGFALILNSSAATRMLAQGKTVTVTKLTT